jgi:pilus assembly protein Flp/PilA
MKSIQKFFYRFIADERGLAAVEYAVVAGLIVAGLITVFGDIGTAASDKLGDLVTGLGGSIT